MTYEQEVNWTKDTLNRMRIGGIWAVPRSGLIFTKRAEDHVELTAVIPFTDDMMQAHELGADVPDSAEALLAHQADDFNCIAKRARDAGYKVTSAVEGITFNE